MRESGERRARRCRWPGIVLFSDGGQNAGIDAQSAILAARDAKIPVFTVGIGSDRRPANVRISDFVAPARAYPGDSFTVTGYLQSQELAGRTRDGRADVETGRRGGQEPIGEGRRDRARDAGRPRRRCCRSSSTLTPGETGRRTFRVDVKAPPEDNNASDNAQEADVEIVDRKTQVLLLASGPTREYIFLRNQLRRDKEMIVDVYLQSGQNGISQDANEILESFPAHAAGTCSSTTRSWLSIPNWAGAGRGRDRPARALGGRKGRRLDRDRRAGRDRPLGAARPRPPRSAACIRSSSIAG